ncbi:hypothetical protein PIIN_00493 [Serendipita indica DSM 11827]|uniref:Uncharacterized protein n=1 Tax=Serendipita indica (strain DSM 11827) TaxID=1109443 RepID=G4U2S6_SERID|nr:hypothetical protein PIIN_00493 [Serendipita indica DSM 11827]
MAKRANPGAAPSYAPLPSVDARARNESGFQKFMREQVWAADKIGGNISILIGPPFCLAVAPRCDFMLFYVITNTLHPASLIRLLNLRAHQGFHRQIHPDGTL